MWVYDSARSHCNQRIVSSDGSVESTLSLRPPHDLIVLWVAGSSGLLLSFIGCRGYSNPDL